MQRKLLQTNTPFLFNGMTQQLHSIVNALIIGHFLDRDVSVVTFTADLARNRLISASLVFDLIVTNQKLTHLVGLKSQLQEEVKDSTNVWIAPEETKQILWKFMPPNLDGVLDLLYRFKETQNLDIVDTFYWPLFHYYHSCPGLPRLVLATLNALTLSSSLQTKLIQHKRSLNIPSIYYCVHLRLESDWINFRTGSVQARHPIRYAGMQPSVYANLMLQKIQHAMNSCFLDPSIPIYVCTSLGKYPAYDTEQILDKFRNQTNIARLIIPTTPQNWCHELGTIEVEEARELEALIDWFIAKETAAFVGFGLSTFSCSLSALLKDHGIPVVNIED